MEQSNQSMVDSQHLNSDLLRFLLKFLFEDGRNGTCSRLFASDAIGKDVLANKERHTLKKSDQTIKAMCKLPRYNRYLKCYKIKEYGEDKHMIRAIVSNESMDRVETCVTTTKISQPSNEMKIFYDNPTISVKDIQDAQSRSVCNVGAPLNAPKSRYPLLKEWNYKLLRESYDAFSANDELKQRYLTDPYIDIKGIARMEKTTTTYAAVALVGLSYIQELIQEATASTGNEDTDAGAELSDLEKRKRALALEAINLAKDDKYTGNLIRVENRTEMVNCGRKAEDTLVEYLVANGHERSSFKTDSEQQKLYHDNLKAGKIYTDEENAEYAGRPDILFNTSATFHGKQIFWIEVKNFVVIPELSYHEKLEEVKSQIERYERIGSGAIYWAKGFSASSRSVFNPDLLHFTLVSGKKYDNNNLLNPVSRTKHVNSMHETYRSAITSQLLAHQFMSMGSHHPKLMIGVKLGGDRTNTQQLSQEEMREIRLRKMDMQGKVSDEPQAGVEDSSYNEKEISLLAGNDIQEIDYIVSLDNESDEESDGDDYSESEYSDDEHSDDDVQDSVESEAMMFTTKLFQYLEIIAQHKRDGKGAEALDFLLKVVDRIINNPDDGRYRSLKTSSKQISSVDKVYGFKVVLNHLGFRESDDKVYFTLSSDNSHLPNLEETRKKLVDMLHD